jgi:hypothetical protein
MLKNAGKANRLQRNPSLEAGEPYSLKKLSDLFRKSLRFPSAARINDVIITFPD